jgi:hypothetical protein
MYAARIQHYQNDQKMDQTHEHAYANHDQISLAFPEHKQNMSWDIQGQRNSIGKVSSTANESS